MQTETKILFEKAMKSCWSLQYQVFLWGPFAGSRSDFPKPTLPPIGSVFYKMQFWWSFCFPFLSACFMNFIQIGMGGRRGFLLFPEQISQFGVMTKNTGFHSCPVSYLYDLGKLLRAFWVVAFSSIKWTNVEQCLAYNLCSMNIS